jgi:predicted metalloprotease
MRWRNRRQSGNVVDRRGMRPAAAIGGGAGIIVLLLGLVLGVDLTDLVPDTNTTLVQDTSQPAGFDDEHREFVAVVLADTEEVWSALFQEMGQTYREPRLVMFSDQVQSACGFASAAVGPFYCPADQMAYLDVRFFEDLARELGAPGDFAQAYVIAHEIGHHVQNLLGISDAVHQHRARASEAAGNEMSVRLELQADFFAGVWAHHAQRNWNILEEGDIEEALRAASAIGDDRLQKRSQGHIVPDSFTHGSSEQRVRWFRRGFETGDLSQGDTFSATSL